MDTNVIFSTDQYKANSHWNFMPDYITATTLYGEARAGAKHPIITWNGLQSIVLKSFIGQVINADKIEEADRILRLSNIHDNYFNKEDWYKLLKKYNGRLPLRIKSLPEGTRVPVNNALFIVEGMDDEFPWLSQRCESRLLHSWYPTTIATKSRVNLDIITKYLKESSDLDEETARHLYVDFGYRACSCDEQAAIGGAAHLINCFGSDTIVALKEIDKYYGGLSTVIGEIAYSVPATEHRIAQTYGANEDKYLMDCITKYPKWIVSVVADTRNIENFVDVVVRNRKKEIIERWEKAQGGFAINKLVIRPDSKRSKTDTCTEQIKWIYQKLEDIFGVTTNKKGKKVLHPCIGVLWGDGINDNEIESLYRGVSHSGYSVESLVIGQGGGLLVKNADRDTESFAAKACQEKHDDGLWYDLIKDPLDSSKKSKAGDLRVIRPGNCQFETINQHDSRYGFYPDELVTIAEMGEMVRQYSFKEVRNNGKK